jgi:hypothetical protein
MCSTLFRWTVFRVFFKLAPPDDLLDCLCRIQQSWFAFLIFLRKIKLNKIAITSVALIDLSKINFDAGLHYFSTHVKWCYMLVGQWASHSCVNWVRLLGNSFWSCEETHLLLPELPRVIKIKAFQCIGKLCFIVFEESSGRMRLVYRVILVWFAGAWHVYLVKIHAM